GREALRRRDDAGDTRPAQPRAAAATRGAPRRESAVARSAAREGHRGAARKRARADRVDRTDSARTAVGARYSARAATSAHGLVVRADVLEVEQRAIREMRRRHVLKAAEQPIGTARVLLFPLCEHRLDFAALHVVLRAAELARNDRELAAARVARDVALGA